MRKKHYFGRGVMFLLCLIFAVAFLLPTVLTIENPRTRIAQTIVESTQAKNQKILSLDSMQGTTAADIAAGATYLGIMESNLAVLRDALN